MKKPIIKSIPLFPEVLIRKQGEHTKMYLLDTYVRKWIDGAYRLIHVAAESTYETLQPELTESSAWQRLMIDCCLAKRFYTNTDEEWTITDPDQSPEETRLLDLYGPRKECRDDDNTASL